MELHPEPVTAPIACGESLAGCETPQDQLDARTLARLVRADPELLYPIQHRGDQARQDLVLLCVREGLVAARTKLINCVRGQVKSVGGRLPSCSSDGSRFIPAPDQFEFHEYRVMEEFIRSIDDNEAANQLWDAINGRGAFRYFKDTLHRLGIQQLWYDYLEKAQREFVIAWAKENNVAFEDDLRKSRK